MRHPQGLRFVGMMQYDGDLKLPANYLVPPPEISHVSGEYLVRNGLSTFACSETQKFGHVTFFWNGNRSGYLDAKLEQYLEVGVGGGRVQWWVGLRCGVHSTHAQVVCAGCWGRRAISGQRWGLRMEAEYVVKATAIGNERYVLWERMVGSGPRGWGRRMRVGNGKDLSGYKLICRS